MNLAIFDFDGTIFMKETLPFLLKQWKKQKLSSVKLYKTYASILHLYLLYKLKWYFIMPAEKIRIVSFKKLLKIFKGMTRKQISSFLEICAKDARAYFNEDVIKAIETANRNGYHTVILSGCYSMMLYYIANMLNIKTVIGTDLHFDKNDRVDLSHPLIIPNGEQKALSIKERFAYTDIDWENSIAYADSDHDIHVFNLVGTAIAVNPNDKLKDMAQAQGWEVLA